MFSHLDAQNRPAMVNVGAKAVTKRTAHAVAVVTLPATLAALLRDGEIATKKGPIFQTAILAGVMGAKKTSDLIPLCHSLPLDDCQIEIVPQRTTAPAPIKMSRRRNIEEISDLKSEIVSRQSEI